MKMRYSEKERNTKETKIKLSLELDRTGSGGLTGTSGIGFFDHMLNSFAVHGGFAVALEMTGDLNVDGHHTVEDVGIVLGSLFAEILGSRSGIARFAHEYVPMDEALAFAAVDVSGRPFLHFDSSACPSIAEGQLIGEYDASLTVEFFRALAFNAGFTLHMKLEYGSNTHHAVEALFKAAARAISAAVRETGGGVLSAKGVLG